MAAEALGNLGLAAKERMGSSDDRCATVSGTTDWAILDEVIPTTLYFLHLL